MLIVRDKGVPLSFLARRQKKKKKKEKIIGGFIRTKMPVLRGPKFLLA